MAASATNGRHFQIKTSVHLLIIGFYTVLLSEYELIAKYFNIICEKIVPTSNGPHK